MANQVVDVSGAKEAWVAPTDGAVRGLNWKLVRVSRENNTMADNLAKAGIDRIRLVSECDRAWRIAA
ncbi:hypothetical protein V6N12_067317 [Hibiscus sabdariffa]|uniref:RNase H type-1 domain-containing protein n=1 Tax=Hibiscus sabdariffa TaxID=183260 RepID=A0ABR2BER0_9ROSI